MSGNAHADDDRARQLEELLRGLFVLLLRRAGPRADAAEILAAARRAAEQLLAQCIQPVRWETARHSTIHGSRRPTMLFRPVRLVAHVLEMSEPQLVVIPDATGASSQTVATSLRLDDLEQDQIDTLDVVGEDLVDRLWEARRQPRLEVLGRILTVPVNPSGTREAFVLQVFDLRDSQSTLDLLGASDTERANVTTLIAELRRCGTSPLDHLQQRLEEGLRVVALDGFPLLRQLLRFTVLQALSWGRLDHASGRLHAIIAGPPASGKKLIGLAARALNPRCEEASAAKITAAGLVGASHPAKGGWRSQPGLIARADGGVVSLQDSHAISPAELRRLGPILQELIEDGVVRDSVAGGLRRETSAALVVDLNRHSQLVRMGARAAAGEAAILLLRPLLSRVDLVVEVPADVKRAWKVGAALYRTIRAGSRSFDELSWVRQLRLLVGALRDAYPEIDLDPVRPAMEAAHEAIERENEHTFERLPEAGDIPVRLAITVARYVSAAARAHGRSVATTDDVDEALAFVRLKLEFLRIAVPDVARAAAASRQSDGYSQAHERHAGQEVRTSDFAKTYGDATGDSISERTARRHLRRLGAVRRGRGLYLLPPSGDPQGGADE